MTAFSINAPNGPISGSESGDGPSVVLSGDRDPVVSPEDTAELARHPPAAELVSIHGAAHSVLAEGGETVLDRVMDFLAE